MRDRVDPLGATSKMDEDIQLRPSAPTLNPLAGAKVAPPVVTLKQSLSCGSLEQLDKINVCRTSHRILLLLCLSLLLFAALGTSGGVLSTVFVHTQLRSFSHPIAGQVLKKNIAKRPSRGSIGAADEEARQAAASAVDSGYGCMRLCVWCDSMTFCLRALGVHTPCFVVWVAGLCVCVCASPDCMHGSVRLPMTRGRLARLDRRFFASVTDSHVFFRHLSIPIVQWGWAPGACLDAQ